MEKGTKATILGVDNVNEKEKAISLHYKDGKYYLDQKYTQSIKYHESKEDQRYNYCIEFPDGYVYKRFYTNFESLGNKYIKPYQINPPSNKVLLLNKGENKDPQ